MHRTIEILLVEDNPADARLVREAFDRGSVPKNVNVVTDGVQAIDYLRRRGTYGAATRPDLILLDLNLPRRDGLDVLREIKSDPELQAITAIVLTTSRYPRDVHTAYELQANCYIVKPVELEQFYRIMRSIEEFWMGMASLPTSGGALPADSGWSTGEASATPPEQSDSTTARAQAGHIRRIHGTGTAAQPRQRSAFRGW